MIKITFALISLISVNAFANDCTINTYSFHYNKTAGTAKAEGVLVDKGYAIVTEQNEKADYSLEIQYFGNSVGKGLGLIVDGPSSRIFGKYIEYKTPFGVEGGIFEKVHVLELVKQVPPCMN